MDRDQEAVEVASTEQTRCCIVGAGPAGAVLGLLLARAGVPVTLLESHPDFDRDFRGDTVHPPTLELLAQLGLAERVHALPHAEVRALRLRTKTQTFTLADIGRLRTPYPYVMVLPQAKLLQLLTDEARRYPHFRLVMRANVQRLVEADGVVRGVRYRDTEDRWHEVRADLTVAADGRFSKLRHLVGIEPIKTAPPMDVVWFRLPKGPVDESESATLYVGGGRFAVVLDRGDEWQVGYAILKGSFSAVKAAGIEALRQGLAEVVPWLADRTGQLHDWSQVAVLNVESSRVERWHRPGLLLIGDAAHVMSLVAGVGINVAIQDAVAAANLLTGPLRRGAVTERDLAAVQQVREPAVRRVQWIQRLMQDRIAAPGLDAAHEFRPPWWLRLLTSVPGLRNLPARMLAFGPNRVQLWDGSAEARRPDMPLDDYPAAHSMDTDWFAIDGEGRVGLFQSGQDGAYPGDAYGGGSLHEGSGPDLEDILRQLLALQPEADLDAREVVDGFVQAGLYVFEATDGEHLSPPVLIHENFLAFPYTLTHRPDQPLHIGQVSPGLAARLRAVRLPASRFGASPTVQPAGQVHGSTWYSYSAVLVAYLDEDGVTIRPIPGQEAQFAGYCRDLLADFPEDTARLSFDPPLKNAGE